MARQAYIVDPNGDQNYIIMVANHRPKGTVAIAPTENGRPVTDIDWLDIVDEIDLETSEVIGKKGVVNATKKQAKLDAVQAKQDALAANQAALQAKRSELQALNPVTDLTSIVDIRNNLVKIMEVLGIR